MAPSEGAATDDEPTLISPDDPDVGPAAAPSDPGVLSPAELKRRASGGVFIVATRGVAILLIGFGGTIVVARLLSPREFGVVAIGMALVLVAGVLSDGDLGAALIRRGEPPSREELQALTAFQLTMTFSLTVLTAAAAPLLGEIGWVAALMVSSMLFVAMQFPGRILLERSLSYRPLALIEVTQVLTYHVWAIAFVVAGFGVWGLASATVAMRVVATLVMAWVSPVGLVRPRLSWRLIQPLLGFGFRFQAASATWVARDHGLNASIAVITSVSTLGLWTLARRVLDVPLLLFESLWRVSFPAMSQLLVSKQDPARLMERAVGMAAVGSGIILTGLAGSAPALIPSVFGEQWSDAVPAIPGACLGLGIGGSISVATVGYLYAVGDASAVLRASILQAVTLLAVTLPLLPFLGIAAVGLGWFVAALVEVAVLRARTLRWTKATLVRPLIAPAVVGVAAAGAGWIIADAGEDLWSGIAGGVCAVAFFHLGLLAVRRELLLETLRFVIASMRAAVAERAAAGTA